MYIYVFSFFHKFAQNDINFERILSAIGRAGDTPARMSGRKQRDDTYSFSSNKN
jgi:hypothetical protein